MSHDAHVDDLAQAGLGAVEGIEDDVQRAVRCADIARPQTGQAREIIKGDLMPSRGCGAVEHDRRIVIEPGRTALEE